MAPIVGIAYDGYYTFCTVYADVNNNRMLDAATEPSGMTDVFGKFSVNLAMAPSGVILDPSSIIVRLLPGPGCIDAGTGQLVPSDTVVAAPFAYNTVLSPLTTLAVQIMNVDPSSSATTAAQLIKSSFSVDPAIDIFSYDPAAAGLTKNDTARAQVVLSAVAQVANTVAQGAPLMGLGNSTNATISSVALYTALAEYLLSHKAASSYAATSAADLTASATTTAIMDSAVGYTAQLGSTVTAPSAAKLAALGSSTAYVNSLLAGNVIADRAGNNMLSTLTYINTLQYVVATSVVPAVTQLSQGTLSVPAFLGNNSVNGSIVAQAAAINIVASNPSYCSYIYAAAATAGNIKLAVNLTSICQPPSPPPPPVGAPAPDNTILIATTASIVPFFLFGGCVAGFLYLRWLALQKKVRPIDTKTAIKLWRAKPTTAKAAAAGRPASAVPYQARPPADIRTVPAAMVPFTLPKPVPPSAPRAHEWSDDDSQLGSEFGDFDTIHPHESDFVLPWSAVISPYAPMPAAPAAAAAPAAKAPAGDAAAEGAAAAPVEPEAPPKAMGLLKMRMAKKAAEKAESAAAASEAGPAADGAAPAEAAAGPSDALTPDALAAAVLPVAANGEHAPAPPPSGSPSGSRPGSARRPGYPLPVSTSTSSHALLQALAVPTPQASSHALLASAVPTPQASSHALLISSAAPTPQASVSALLVPAEEEPPAAPAEPAPAELADDDVAASSSVLLVTDPEPEAPEPEPEVPVEPHVFDPEHPLTEAEELVAGWTEEEMEAARAAEAAHAAWLAEQQDALVREQTAHREAMDAVLAQHRSEMQKMVAEVTKHGDRPARRHRRRSRHHESSDEDSDASGASGRTRQSSPQQPSMPLFNSWMSASGGNPVLNPAMSFQNANQMAMAAAMFNPMVSQQMMQQQQYMQQQMMQQQYMQQAQQQQQQQQYMQQAGQPVGVPNPFGSISGQYGAPYGQQPGYAAAQVAPMLTPWANPMASTASLSGAGYRTAGPPGPATAPPAMPGRPMPMQSPMPMPPPNMPPSPLPGGAPSPSPYPGAARPAPAPAESPEMAHARFEAEVDERAAELGIDVVHEEDLLPIAEAYAKAARELPPGWTTTPDGAYRNVVTGQMSQEHPSKPQFLRMVQQIRGQ